MRVLMVNRYFYPFLGGVEFHIQNLALELVGMGCQVTIACGNRGSKGLPVREEFRGLDLRRVTSPLGLRQVVSEGFDVLHAHMPRSASTLWGLFFAKRYRIPAVLTPHCFYPSRDLMWQLLKVAYDATVLRYTFSLADRVICLTQRDRDDAVARGLPVSKARIIPNCVRVAELSQIEPTDFRAKYKLPWEFLLFVGRFDWVKNVEFLVRAQVRIPSQYGLVLIGQDGGRLERVRNLVDELGLNDRVRIIERASFQDLCGAYRQAQALLLSSLYEGLPTVILEAMFFGCPIVASHVGGVPHVLRGNVVGSTYREGMEEEYVGSVMATLARGRDTEAQGRHLVEREYSWEVNAPRVYELYRELQGAWAAAAA